MNLSAKTLQLIGITFMLFGVAFFLWDAFYIKDNSNHTLMPIGGLLVIIGIIIGSYSKKKKNKESKGV